MLSESMPYEKKFIDVNGRKIAYVDEGSGDPIVLLHGNPYVLVPVAQRCPGAACLWPCDHPRSDWPW